MNLTPIRELVQKTRHLDPKKLGVDSFAYVDISSVDKDTKKITEPQKLLVGDAPSRARKEIKADDVLVATVRPNLNGVAIVPAQYDNQIASTGFCVLRSDIEQLDPNYLFYFTQTDSFISHLTEYQLAQVILLFQMKIFWTPEFPFPADRAKADCVPAGTRRPPASTTADCTRSRRCPAPVRVFRDV